MEKINKNNSSLPDVCTKAGKLKKETPPCIRAEASYTAEASVILPLFTGFMVFLLFFFRMLQVQQIVGNALVETGREMAVIAYEEQNGYAGSSLPLAKIKLLLKLQESGSVAQFVSGGKYGISLSRSDLSGNYVELTADYSLRLPIGLFGRQEIAVSQRVKCRKWTGSQGTDEAGEGEEQIVYITPCGSAYHRDKNCSYLRLSVRQVPASEVENFRNADGGKYYKCRKCMKDQEMHSMVYITAYGNRYHTTTDCMELKRTIQAVRLSQVGSRHACGKCW